jgi:hypothetical protein
MAFNSEGLRLVPNNDTPKALEDKEIHYILLNLQLHGTCWFHPPTILSPEKAPHLSMQHKLGLRSMRRRDDVEKNIVSTESRNLSPILQLPLY